MADIYIELIEYIFLALSVIFLILSVILFFKLRIPSVIRELKGTAGQKQMSQIRDKSIENARRSSAVQVFKELENQSKTKNTSTRRLKKTDSITTVTAEATAEPAGTTVLKKTADKDFVIEKNLVFVSTNDVLR